MITERDIFNYIFFRAKVSDGKVNELITGKHFSAAIEFYSSLKDASVRQLTIREKRSLAAKIPFYKFNGVYELLPFSVGDTANGMRLAARTKNNEESDSAISFLSDTKELLCRIIPTPTQQLLYCFSVNQEELKNFKLTLHPSKITFECKSSAEPVIIPAELAIEKISIEFV
ncbi:MAG: hypothetical protein COZ80_13165 [Ignavibacteria bacterium CG_4_8_14_3_um_filter_37_9]|nr:hypothetical protein [Ignavibacteria bacterium]OIO20444.1 MAG: hypothetical protein AUJ54_05480 [Ignavibacteria bacterium CG1_02_37_35]PIS46160.1 MAG: hypothetical protein COT22_01460 [Ignavibacteria bacterium CG08_land_8_20_14_0_20_37_9]PIW97937.1 MAG: hypothetical protein COZ80_13165 [Ignavibacteria bacterium CG_4_8_14_3_um_filter_37_9]PJC57630.1 MAG: hypothetical protein CO025_12370 [Ignavibacteria bacterium CG_4_9_14_0_2_um_filter_37_13]